MAISARAVGAWAAATATTQTVTLPTHAAGDMLIVRVVAKGPATLVNNTVTCGTSGWAMCGSMYYGGSTASSNGGGSVWSAVFYKEAASSAETDPVLTFQNPSGTNVAMLPSAAVAVSYQKGASDTWVTPWSYGGNVAAATSISANVTNSTVSAGDMVDVFIGTNDNTTLTVPTFTSSGMTFYTVAVYPATALSSATSNDIAATGCYRLATAGTSNSNFIVTATNSVADEGVARATVLRVTSGTPITGTAESGTGSDTSSAPDVAMTATAESGTGSDTASLIAIPADKTDSGTGSDTAALAVDRSGAAESGTASDTSSVLQQKTGSDSGTGSDTAAVAVFPTVVGYAEYGSGASWGTSHVIPLPTGYQEGDLLLLSAANNSYVTNTMSAPAGWTEIQQQNVYFESTLWWKRATGSEGTTVTITTGNMYCAGMSVAIRNASDPESNALPAGNAVVYSALTPSWGSQPYIFVGMGFNVPNSGSEPTAYVAGDIPWGTFYGSPWAAGIRGVFHGLLTETTSNPSYQVSGGTSARSIGYHVAAKYVAPPLAKSGAAESGTATDTASLTADRSATAESGIGSDTAAVPDRAFTATAESGTGADTATLATAVSGTDSGTASDSASKSEEAPVEKTGSDYGTSSP